MSWSMSRMFGSLGMANDIGAGRGRCSSSSAVPALSVFVTSLRPLDFAAQHPYYWAWLPFAKEPFSEETRQQVLPQIDDTDFVRDLCDDLRKLFQTDKGFDKTMFESQMAVMRGQIFNLREALRTGKSPLGLVQMPPQMMVEVRHRKRRGRGDSDAADGPRRVEWHDAYRQKVQTRGPFFSWC